VSDAYYCVSCTRLEKDREGCPKIINLGSSKTGKVLSTLLDMTSKDSLLGFLVDLFYERKKFGFKKG
jgi:PHD finger-like domain-containing protein 5A